jgi:hypothetical protein
MFQLNNRKGAIAQHFVRIRHAEGGLGKRPNVADPAMS